MLIGQPKMLSYRTKPMSLRFVQSKWDKHKPGKELSVTNLFDIVAVQIFLRRLQEGSDRSAYDYICGQLHDVWDLNSAVAYAKNYIDRRQKDDSLEPVGNQSAFFGQKSNRGRPNQQKTSQSQPKPDQADKSKNQKSDSGQHSAVKVPYNLLREIAPGTCHKWVAGKCNYGPKCRYKHSWPAKEDKSDPKPKEQANVFFNQAGFQ